MDQAKNIGETRIKKKEFVNQLGKLFVSQNTRRPIIQYS